VPIEPGLTATVRRAVGPDDTAATLGSGDLDVLGTPRLLAWCEQATVAAVAPHLADTATTVGTRVDLAHERASAVGSEVVVRADLVAVDGRLLRFDVVAEQEQGDAGSTVVVGRATVTRVVVDRERFLARVTPPGT
jgi:predicted thioesterase